MFTAPAAAGPVSYRSCSRVCRLQNVADHPEQHMPKAACAKGWISTPFVLAVLGSSFLPGQYVYGGSRYKTLGTGPMVSHGGGRHQKTMSLEGLLLASDIWGPHGNTYYPAKFSGKNQGNLSGRPLKRRCSFKLILKDGLGATLGEE